MLIDLVATFKLKIILMRAECFTEVLNQSVDRGFYCLYSPPSSQPRRPGTSSRVLRKRCLSALQDFCREERPHKAIVVLSSTGSMLFYFTVLVK